MKVYQFIIPENGHLEWAKTALHAAGGITDFGLVVGKWLNDGATYRDINRHYQVACSRVVADFLIARAFEVFPNEKAIYVARIGKAKIIPRPLATHGERVEARAKANSAW